MSEDRKKELLMKAVDGIASQEELAELEEYARDDLSLKDELKAFRRIKEVTDSIMFKELPDSYWDGYWAGIYNRLERGLGWIFFSIGAIILLGVGAYYLLKDFFLSPQVSLIVKLEIGCGGLGVIMLLVSISREVLYARKKERYKEVRI